MAQLKYWDGTQYLPVDIGPSASVDEVVITPAEPTAHPDLWIDSGDSAQVGGPMDRVSADERYVDIAGDTASALTLAADPVQPLEAVTKQYVDQVVTVSSSDPMSFVPARDGLIWIQMPGAPVAGRSWDEVAAEFPSWDELAAGVQPGLPG